VSVRGVRGKAALATTAAGAAAAAIAVAVALSAGAQGPTPSPAPAPAPIPAATGAPALTPASSSAPRDVVRIVFTVWPPKTKAFVFWGKRRLGMIAQRAPLTVERPRDSGPLDVVVHAEGFVPVQTRAYTFGDSKVAVKLTPLDQKKTLLGYREEVPPEPDGGVPPALPSSLPAPAPPGSAPSPGAGPWAPWTPDAGAR
jgi:hypothetical protein